MLPTSTMTEVAVEAARLAGTLLLEASASARRAQLKGDQHNVVTQADLDSESLLLERLRRHFPDQSVLSEEAGCLVRDPSQVWVIDPLDGSSNFAAGVPWFGVLIAQLTAGEPVLAVMYLPCSDELYVAERGRGAFKNGVPIGVSDASSLKDVLWACGMDDPGEGERASEKLSVLHAILRATRNVRTTNSLLDAALTADGRLGGMLNWSCRIWDIAAPWLIVREAGGLYTDVAGDPIEFDLSEGAAQREYAVLAAARELHPQMRDLIADARPNVTGRGWL